MSDYHGTAPEGRRIEYHPKLEPDPLQEARRLGEWLRVTANKLGWNAQERTELTRAANRIDALAQRVEDAETALDRIAKAHAPASHLQKIARQALRQEGE